jgi:hypothetical protein
LPALTAKLPTPKKAIGQLTDVILHKPPIRPNNHYRPQPIFAKTGHPVKIPTRNGNKLAVNFGLPPVVRVGIVHIQAIVIKTAHDQPMRGFFAVIKKVLIKINGIAPA